MEKLRVQMKIRKLRKKIALSAQIDGYIPPKMWEDLEKLKKKL